MMIRCLKTECIYAKHFAIYQGYLGNVQIFYLGYPFTKSIESLTSTLQMCIIVEVCKEIPYCKLEEVSNDSK